MTIVFSEVPAEVVESSRRERRSNKLGRAMRKILRKPGANIMILGVGGAGRNAIRNLKKLKMSSSVELKVLDTQVGSDQERYS